MMQHKTIILVGGLFGEFLRLPFTAGYFRPLENWMSDRYDNLEFRYIQNKFWKLVARGVQKSRTALLEEMFFRDKSVSVLAHSRGALEMFELLTTHPQLLRSNNLQKVVLMAPVFGPSPVARFFVRYGRRILPRRVFRALSEMANLDLGQRVLEQFDSLSPTDRETFLQKVVIYKTASQKNWDYPFFLKPFFKSMRKAGIKNDGLLSLRAQSTLKVVRAQQWNTHHGSLLCWGGFARHSRTLFNKFTDQLATDLGLEDQLSAIGSPLLSEGSYATYNCGQLNIPVWGIPFCRERSHFIPSVLKEINSDVVFLQEAFTPDVQSKLQMLSSEFEVLSVGPARQHGLFTLVRKEYIRKFKVLSLFFKDFDRQRWVEPKTKFQKGYLQLHLQDLQTQQIITLVNVHFTAFQTASKIRKAQREEMCRAISDLSAMGDVVVGGDFNSNFGMKGGRPTHENQRIDHVFYFSQEVGPISPVDETVLLDEAIVPVKGGNRVEVSDHRMLERSFQGGVQ